ncbi:MAG: SPASM domain-containing protein, partial [Patescibacteria group bacterium]|nr:SPASM domain-containing protein [Patescibacteria group bacterium]
THDKIRGVPGMFDKVIKSIKELNKSRKEKPSNKTKIRINFVLQKDNVKDLAYLSGMAKKLGVDEARIEVIHEEPRLNVLKSDYPLIKKFLKNFKNDKRLDITPFIDMLVKGKLGKDYDGRGLRVKNLFLDYPVPCFKCYMYSLVDAHGFVFPCMYLYYDTRGDAFDAKRRQYRMGNIHKEKFSKIWNNVKYAEFRKKTNPVNLRSYPACANCELYSDFKNTYQQLMKKTNSSSRANEFLAFLNVVRHH